MDNHGWGVKPISGPYNKSGSWGGALGGIINNEYMFSLSAWVWVIERSDLVDFLPNTFDRVLLALTPANPSIDFTLFLRPFTTQAWRGIGATILVIIACIITPYTLLKRYSDTDRYALMT